MTNSQGACDKGDRDKRMYPRVHITQKYMHIFLKKNSSMMITANWHTCHCVLTKEGSKTYTLLFPLSKCLYSKKYNIPLWLTQCFSHEFNPCIFSEGLQLLIIKVCSRIQTIYIDNWINIVQCLQAREQEAWFEVAIQQLYLSCYQQSYLRCQTDSRSTWPTPRYAFSLRNKEKHKIIFKLSTNTSSK